MSISLIQQVVGNTALAASYPVTIATPTAGNSLIACIETSTLTKLMTSISGGGVTWAPAIQIASLSGTVSEIWFGHGSSGSGSTITLTYGSKSTAVGSVNITEWAGLNNAVPDATGSNKAAVNANPAAGAVTTGFANSLIISTGCWSANDYQSGPTNSFNRGTTFNDGIDFAEMAYKIVAVSAAYSTAWVLSAGVNWAATVASFGAPNSGPTAAQASAGFFMGVR